jgi:hypothetical protein
LLVALQERCCWQAAGAEPPHLKLFAEEQHSFPSCNAVYQSIVCKEAGVKDPRNLPATLTQLEDVPQPRISAIALTHNSTIALVYCPPDVRDL